MILEIENYQGERICGLDINPYDEEEMMPIVENTCGNVSIADYDFDDIFGTNDYKIRISLDDIGKKTFLTLNEVGFTHKSRTVVNLMQELKSYEALIESFKEKRYNNCGVLISNYFGHINYWEQFGYDKTHEEIIQILYNNMLWQLESGKDSFEDFCKRMMNKIKWNLQNEHGIENIEECYQNGWLP